MPLVSKPHAGAARSGVASFVWQACLWANIFILLALALAYAVPGDGFAPAESADPADVSMNVVTRDEKPAQPAVNPPSGDRRHAPARLAPKSGVSRDIVIRDEAPAQPSVSPRSADPWQAYVAEASARFRIPESWIRAVMQVESGGRTMQAGLPITSPKGAKGLMQVMGQTYADLRARYGFGPDAHDPRDNILAGVAYLSELHDQFGYPMLFAAYNAGPSRTAQALKKGSRLPAETRAYLKKVTANVEKAA
jgi:soluble lytic murein transglycosylase-like protein